MFSVSYEYISLPLETAKQTEITTYMWPGFLAELCEGELTVWELCAPTEWNQRSDIAAPPASCIGITSSQALCWEQGQERLVGHLLDSQKVVQRVLTPSQPSKLTVQQQQSLVSLCKS